MNRGLSVAVLIPCCNEELAVAKTVREFRQAIPQAVVYVYDNNSTDRTAQLAADAGAVVRSEPLRGKGHVVRRMFSDVDADIYVLVDGDATYDANATQAMIERLVDENLDMVVGKRVHLSVDAYRRGHVVGNRVMSRFLGSLFGQRCTDLFSGYRVFSRRFVKSFPALSTGFETETELTVHALRLDMPMAEIETHYSARPAGSESKLKTYRHGLRIFLVMLALFRNERPLIFFGGVASVLAVVSLGLAWPLVTTFAETGLVPRLPTAVLCAAIMLLAFLSLSCGLILDTVTRGRRELRRLFYLQSPSVQDAGRADRSAR